MIADEDRRRLCDMADHARYAIDLLGDLGTSDLATDMRSRFAVVHAIEIVGEAAAKVSTSARTGVALPWTRVVGMRNILIHGYPDIDLSRVVNVVRNDLPALIAQIEAALGDLDT